MAVSPYKYVKRRNHPLTTPSGLIPEHRVVLYDKIGPGPHPCHWQCGKTVDWMPGHATRKGALVADHLDGRQRNNDPANLVPSCHPCNQRRPFDAQFADGQPFVVLGGRRHAATARACQAPECGRTFLVATKYLTYQREGRRAGRYCSRACMYAGRA